MEQGAGLERFVRAHERDYADALSEIRRGRKTTHWMWYIFPQLRGLGRSEISEWYAIRDLDEARAFLAHPYLGHNLREISQALLGLKGLTAREIFGSPDDMKLRSCMTLFARASEDNGGGQVFRDVLSTYYGGREDRRTVELLRESDKPKPQA